MFRVVGFFVKFRVIGKELCPEKANKKPYSGYGLQDLEPEKCIS